MTDAPKPRREQRLTVPAAEYTAGLAQCRRCRAPVVLWVYPKTGNQQVLEVSTARRSAIAAPPLPPPWLLESHFAYCPHAKRRARKRPTEAERNHQRDQRDPFLTA